MAFLALAAAFAFGAPIALLIYYKKKGAEVLPFFIGCAVLILFALILEALVHNIVLKGLTVGEKIMGNTLLYAVYGGLMAGLFEETGRFIAFKTVLKKRLGNDWNALMYGAGHGGVECILLLGFAYISNLVMSILINAGLTDTITKSLSGDTLAQVEAIFDTLTGTAPWTYLLGMVERAAAMALHISLSVLVWFAAKKPGKFLLYPLAILLHALMDGVTVILAAHLPVAAVEGCLVALAILVALVARYVWKKEVNSPAVSEICPAGK